jgi:hypothetical protein
MGQCRLASRPVRAAERVLRRAGGISDRRHSHGSRAVIPADPASSSDGARVVVPSGSSVVVPSDPIVAIPAFAGMTVKEAGMTVEEARDRGGCALRWRRRTAVEVAR